MSIGSAELWWASVTEARSHASQWPKRGRYHAGGDYMSGWEEVGPYVLMRNDTVARQHWIIRL